MGRQMICLATLSIASIAAFPTAAWAQESRAQKDDANIAICELHKQAGSETSDGPSYFLGMQFDPGLKGNVSAGAVRISDPNGLMRGQTIGHVEQDGDGITFFPIGSWPVGGAESLTLFLRHRPDQPKYFSIGIGEERSKKFGITFFGNCLVEYYPQGANMMFDAMKSKPPVSMEPAK